MRRARGRCIRRRRNSASETRPATYWLDPSRAVDVENAYPGTLATPRTPIRSRAAIGVPPNPTREWLLYVELAHSDRNADQLADRVVHQLTDLGSRELAAGGRSFIQTDVVSRQQFGAI